jgi:cell division septum initiation protein DivIVA
MADKSSTTDIDLSSSGPNDIGNPEEDGNQDSEGLSTKKSEKEALDPKEKAGFQRLVAKKDEEIKSYRERLDDMSEKLSRLQQAEREKRLEGLTEAERWKAEAQDNARRAAEAELRSLVTAQASIKGVMNHPVVQILLETPWAIPAVKKRLTADSTWEETIELVKTHLPSYLDSLVEPETETPQTKKIENLPPREEEVPEGMETERSGSARTEKRTWTRAEVKKYLEDAENDPVKFQKRNEEITRAINEGRVQ